MSKQINQRLLFLIVALMVFAQADAWAAKKLSRPVVGVERSHNRYSHLKDSNEASQLESESAEVDNYVYDDLATQTAIESKQLEKEIRKLDYKIGQTKKSLVNTKARSDSEMLKKARVEKKKALTEKALADLEKKRLKSEQRLNELRARTEVLERKAKEEGDKSQKARLALRELDKEQTQLLRRQRKAETVLQKERKKRQYLETQRSKYFSRVKVMRAQVYDLEKRAGAPKTRMATSANKTNSGMLRL